MHYKFNILNFKSLFLMNYSIISEYSSNSLLANKKGLFYVLNSYFMLVFQYGQYNYRFI